MNVISKDLFVEVINDLMAACDYAEDLNKFFESHDVDGYIYQPDCFVTVMKLLITLFKDEAQWLDTYIFNLEFGKKWKPGSIVDDGKEIKLSTPEELYDVLISCM